jgi:hypothetical protein
MSMHMRVHVYVHVWAWVHIPRGWSGGPGWSKAHEAERVAVQHLKCFLQLWPCVVCVCERESARACVRACERASERACVRACVRGCVGAWHGSES